LADKLKPRWIVWENVPGVLSSNGGRDFGSFVGALGQLGYGWAMRILDAQHFGVPQRRRRVFVVACLGDWRAAAEVLSLREGLRGYLETGNKKRKGVAADAGASVAASRINCQPDGISGAVTSKWSKGSGGPAGDEHYNMITQPVSHWEGGNVHPTLNQSAKGSGGVGSSNQELFSQGGAYLVPGQPIPIQDGREIEKHQNGMGVGNSGDPAYTIDTTGAQAAAIPFRKSKRACSTTDNETWVPADASNTLNNFDLGDTRTTHAVVQPVGFSMREDATNGTFDVKQVDTSLCLQALRPAVTSHHAQNIVVQPSVYENHAQDSRVTGPLEVAPTVAAKFGTGGGNVPLVGAMAVRRLTPVECERLQGFPDNWSRISWKGKPEEECPDGPRYKACGNSMAVPVMRWIGERIAAVDATLSPHA
jgi:DNA (cytosine-5)-methyltransferase 1